MTTESAYAAVLNSRYRVFGVNATITNPATRASATLRMIDFTKGITTGTDFAQVPTVQPVAAAKMADVTALGFKPEDLVGEAINLNGLDWVVASYAHHPGPFGPALSQVYFTLEEPTV